MFYNKTLYNSDKKMAEPTLDIWVEYSENRNARKLVKIWLSAYYAVILYNAKSYSITHNFRSISPEKMPFFAFFRVENRVGNFSILFCFALNFFRISVARIHTGGPIGYSRGTGTVISYLYHVT